MQPRSKAPKSFATRAPVSRASASSSRSSPAEYSSEGEDSDYSGDVAEHVSGSRLSQQALLSETKKRQQAEAQARVVQGRKGQGKKGRDSTSRPQSTRSSARNSSTHESSKMKRAEEKRRAQKGFLGRFCEDVCNRDLEAIAILVLGGLLLACVVVLVVLVIGMLAGKNDETGSTNPDDDDPAVPGGKPNNRPPAGNRSPPGGGKPPGGGGGGSPRGPNACPPNLKGTKIRLNFNFGGYTDEHETNVYNTLCAASGVRQSKCKARAPRCDGSVVLLPELDRRVERDMKSYGAIGLSRVLTEGMKGLIPAENLPAGFAVEVKEEGTQIDDEPLPA